MAPSRARRPTHGRNFRSRISVSPRTKPRTRHRGIRRIDKKADWIPTFVDYLYLSTTNSSAFSPTDTMPLTSRAEILMGVQATAALITSLLVIARAVGALGGG